MGIKFDILHDVVDKIILVEFKLNVAAVEFSVEFAEIVTVLNRNELDW